MVTEENLSQVVDMSIAFKNYIDTVHEGISDGDRAYKFGLRDDRVRNPEV
jgi:hypothetical protein